MAVQGRVPFHEPGDGPTGVRQFVPPPGVLLYDIRIS